MARPQDHDCALASLALLLLLFPAATQTTTSYSLLCRKPGPAPDLPAGYPRTARRTVPVITRGHFSGGEDLRFAPDQSDIPRSFSLHPRRAPCPTTDPAVLHVFAKLTLMGTHRSRPHSVSFHLDGYYFTGANATTSSYAEACMVGSGSYAREDGLGVVLLSDVVLRIHVPRPCNLSRPFITGRLDGAEFGDVTLVSYADHSDYEYGEPASCPAPPDSVPQLVRRDRDMGLWCHNLKALLQGFHDLEMYGGDSGSPLRLPHRRVYFNQMSCDGNGKLRAYIAFDTNVSEARLSNYSTVGLRQGIMAVGDEALVAEGFWNASQSQLCLRACRVVRAGASRAHLAVQECGVGVSLWLPTTVWSIRDRSFAAGLIWNTSAISDRDTGKISASRAMETTSLTSSTGASEWRRPRSTTTSLQPGVEQGEEGSCNMNNCRCE